MPCTTEELEEAKSEADILIVRAVNMFESKTGLHIDGIELISQDSLSSNPKPINISVNFIIKV